MSDFESAPLEQQDRLHELYATPQEAVDASNRDVITAIYAAAQEPLPPTLVQETNGSKAYLLSSGLVRLVYNFEREEALNDIYGRPIHPATDKLSELLESGKVARTNVPEVLRYGFRPANDPLYEAIDRSWPPIYAFTDMESGNVLCYSIKNGTDSHAQTVLISPEHVLIPPTQ